MAPEDTKVTNISMRLILTMMGKEVTASANNPSILYKFTLENLTNYFRDCLLTQFTKDAINQAWNSKTSAQTYYDEGLLYPYLASDSDYLRLFIQLLNSSNEADIRIAEKLWNKNHLADVAKNLETKDQITLLKNIANSKVSFLFFSTFIGFQSASVLHAVRNLAFTQNDAHSLILAKLSSLSYSKRFSTENNTESSTEESNKDIPPHFNDDQLTDYAHNTHLKTETELLSQKLKVGSFMQHGIIFLFLDILIKFFKLSLREGHQENIDSMLTSQLFHSYITGSVISIGNKYHQLSENTLYKILTLAITHHNENIFLGILEKNTDFFEKNESKLLELLKLAITHKNEKAALCIFNKNIVHFKKIIHSSDPRTQYELLDFIRTHTITSTTSIKDNFFRHYIKSIYPTGKYHYVLQTYALSLTGNASKRNAKKIIDLNTPVFSSPSVTLTQPHHSRGHSKKLFQSSSRTISSAKMLSEIGFLKRTKRNADHDLALETQTNRAKNVRIN